MKIDDPSAGPGRWRGWGWGVGRLDSKTLDREWGESQNKFMNAIGRCDLAQI